MRTDQGRIVEISQALDGQRGWMIACPPALIPSVGQYVSAYHRDDSDQPLPAVLFPTGIWEGGFLTEPEDHLRWSLGDSIVMTGPLGNGFRIPPQVCKIALAGLGKSASRLIPLVDQALKEGLEIALFAQRKPSSLPAEVELHPVDALPDALPWADFLVLDLPGRMLNDLRSCLGLERNAQLPCPGQALLITAMPCWGTASCGACAIHAPGKKLLACEDGPVFDIDKLI